jgi:hypothetical protein
LVNSSVFVNDVFLSEVLYMLNFKRRGPAVCDAQAHLYRHGERQFKQTSCILLPPRTRARCKEYAKMQTRKCTHTHTHTYTPHKQTHKRTMHTHLRARTCTHAHTHRELCPTSPPLAATLWMTRFWRWSSWAKARWVKLLGHAFNRY